MLKKRLTTVLLCAFYVAVACCFGLLHDHHDANAREHCAACAWAIHSVSDAPVVVSHVPVEFVETSHPLREIPLVVAAFFLPTSSRAPPTASA